MTDAICGWVIYQGDAPCTEPPIPGGKRCRAHEPWDCDAPEWTL